MMLTLLAFLLLFQLQGRVHRWVEKTIKFFETSESKEIKCCRLWESIFLSPSPFFFIIPHLLPLLRWDRFNGLLAPLRQGPGCLHAVVGTLLDLLIMTVHFHLFSCEEAGHPRSRNQQVLWRPGPRRQFFTGWKVGDRRRLSNLMPFPWSSVEGLKSIWSHHTSQGTCLFTVA